MNRISGTAGRRHQEGWEWAKLRPWDRAGETPPGNVGGCGPRGPPAVKGHSCVVGCTGPRGREARLGRRGVTLGAAWAPGQFLRLRAGRRSGPSGRARVHSSRRFQAPGRSSVTVTCSSLLESVDSHHGIPTSWRMNEMEVVKKKKSRFTMTFPLLVFPMEPQLSQQPGPSRSLDKRWLLSPNVSSTPSPPCVPEGLPQGSSPHQRPRGGGRLLQTSSGSPSRQTSSGGRRVPQG